MGFTRQYFKECNFMLTTLSGDVNDQNLLRHVISLNHETEGISGLRELADCRNIADMSCLSVQGTADCAALENNRPDSLLALLVNDSSLMFGLARAYQTFSEERRKDTDIFKDLDSALAWLAADEREMDLLRDFIAKAQL
jgi:hypothetical protein